MYDISAAIWAMGREQFAHDANGSIAFTYLQFIIGLHYEIVKLTKRGNSLQLLVTFFTEWICMLYLRQ